MFAVIFLLVAASMLLITLKIKPTPFEVYNYTYI